MLTHAICWPTSLLICHAALASARDCERRTGVTVTGDVPAAISYDVFSALHPIKAARIAPMMSTQQVKMLRDGTRACVITDDGVADPSAVLIRVPDEPVDYWVNRWDISIDSPSKRS
ncbi:hypothetical protein [Caballeronia sp. LZ031]|nr:hypothetical protein [Caballeronia sp. LZ031]MDR5755187.1 hypothetical protein [Caballeronia sp. LZ024]MDR5845034.1 hypothetical protein [Caballeronia sp. LZ031]